MDFDSKQNIALVRYTLIAPAVTGTRPREQSLNAYFQEASGKLILMPDGSYRSFSASSIEKWYRSYKKNGFNGLLPTDRNDQGKSRKVTKKTAERIKGLLLEYPGLPATEAFRILKSDGVIDEGEISLSTFTREVGRIREKENMNEDNEMRRYERPHINEVWAGDTCVGPYIKADDLDGKKHKVFIIGLIDDASRFPTEVKAYYNDNTENLMDCMKSAVQKTGTPRVWNFDNGKNYRNKQMELLSARIGTTIHYCHPYSPTEKAKIERFWLTMRKQLLASMDLNSIHSLEDFQKELDAWVLRYTNTVHSALGKTPRERFFSEAEYIRRLDRDLIESSFLFEEEHRVSADNVVVINKTQYETDSRYARQRLRFRFSPDMEKVFIVEKDGKLVPIHLLDKIANADAKRNKTYISQDNGGNSDD